MRGLNPSGTRQEHRTDCIGRECDLGEDGLAPAPRALKWNISLRIQMTGKHAMRTTKDDERLQPIPHNREQQNNKLRPKPRIVSPLRKRMKCYKTLKT